MYNHIKFYKRPSCTTLLTGKAKCLEIKTVLTVTNDLGEKFFFGDLDVFVELVLTTAGPKRSKDSTASETVLNSQTIHWSVGSRAITYVVRLPLTTVKKNAQFYVRASVPEPGNAVDMLLESYENTSDNVAPATFLPIRSIPCNFSDPTKDKNTCDSEYLALRNLETECPGLNINVVEETKGDIASHIWDAAMAVAKELCSGRLKEYVGTPRSIIELGAGCGFTGLVMAALFPSAQVLLTDFEEARAACQRNIDLNLDALPKASKRARIGLTGLQPATSGTTSATGSEQDRVLFHPLQWEESDPAKIPMPVYRHDHGKHEGWDIVLVTDCIYNKSSFGPLLAILEKLMLPGTLLVLAHKYRSGDSGELFYEMLQEKFEFVHDYSVERYDERIRLLTVQRRPTKE